MFIRRNMSNNVSYQQLKEYALFKQLASVNDVMILKEILPMVVKKVSFDPHKQMHFKNNVIYLPQDHYQTIAQGQNVEQLITQRRHENNRIKFFMIETKIYKILKSLFYKKIDCMENMKNFEKLNFFYRCNLDQIPFGSYIYRKYDQITHIYYLVKGEIQISKSIDQKQINITTIHNGSFFGIYEFDQNKTKRILNACSTSNNTIILSISLDLLTELFGKDQDEVLQKLLALNSQISKINKQESKNLLFQTSKIKKTSFIKAYEFQKRLIKFSNQRKIVKKDPVFAKYIQNKSLIYKIKDSDVFLPKQQKQNANNFVNFHKNESMVKYCNRLNKHRMSTLCLFTQNNEQNLQKIKKTRPSREGDLLSSKLKKRFNQSKRNFSMTGFDSIKKSQKLQFL